MFLPKYLQAARISAFVVCFSIPACHPSALVAEPIDFSRDIFSVLQRSCFECHGSDRQEAGLRLDQRVAMIDAGVISESDPDGSELVRRIELPRGHEEVMPVIGDPLARREIASIRKWVAAGAPWPDDFVPPPHWSYVAPKLPELPEVSDASWVHTPVDRFVLAKLDAIGWEPSPAAEKAVLLRRVYLDLIGLPPSLEEITAFESNPTDEAYRRVVEDLLSRPQFGERWARPWLDLARYADSHGFQRDDLRDIWAYRDWVIQALNTDMPFDQFTIEQIAGDLLPDATQAQQIATGFHRCAPTNVEAGSLPEETRAEQLIDRVNTTASVWLGSTLECAQCHDHKYDPFSTKEYYQILAFFNNTAIEADLKDKSVASSIAFIGASIPIANAERDAERREVEREQGTIRSRLKKRRTELASSLADWSKEFLHDTSQRPRSYPMEITNFESEGNTDSYRLRDDGALLLVGSDPPGADQYTVTAKVQGGMIHAIQLDALTDESLPGKGPGRGDAKRTNFVLNEFRAFVETSQGTSCELEFNDASADFSQQGYDVSRAIDGDESTGWAVAPQFSRPHKATFRLAKPLDATEETTLKLTMSQTFGKSRTIGCFQLSAMTGDVSLEAISDTVVAIAGRPASSWNKQERQVILDYRVTKDPQSTELQQQMEAHDRRIASLAADRTEIMREIDRPRESYVFERGDYRSKGQTIQPKTPTSLHPLSRDADASTPPNRLDLAKWLVDPANPLVARVTVNRYWMELFGAGLVRTPEDFGLKGERPTHPGLLDWLAVDFIQNGWSMKHTLKTIVLSATYQQSSNLTPTLMASDDQNRSLARGPRVRMDAEMIRDNGLAISGLISLKQFGPPIRPYQPEGLWRKVGGQKYDYVVSPGKEKYRRGIYIVIKRGSPYPSLVNFDASNRLSCTVQRSRSNTPLQALTLLNDPVYVEMTKAMAIDAVVMAKSTSVADTISKHWRRAVARKPTPAEVDRLVQLHHDQVKSLQHQPTTATELTQGIDFPEDVDAVEFAAWYAVSTVIFNLHEIITKE